MTTWSKGRGKMGFMSPLLGTWKAQVPETPMGPVVCIRTFRKVLDGKFIELTADWNIGGGKKLYRETAMYGLCRDGIPSFWSFTTDGGTSFGTLADVSDLEGAAFGFEAEMTKGLARLAVIPMGEGFVWAADAKTKKGWSELVRHHCLPVEDPAL